MDSGNDGKAEEKKELFSNLDKLKNDVNSLRKELNKFDDDKESWFSRKEDIAGTIKKKIKAIKQTKEKRDSLTKSVKDLKEKRNKLNEEVRKNISGLINLKDNLKGLTNKSKIKDPGAIKGEIGRIEAKLETEAMSFEKEKELSKKLKSLKKLLSEAGEIIRAQDKIKKFNSEIDTAKKKTDDVHKEIQSLAQESQKLHEEIIKSSKEIDELNVQEEAAFKNFVSLKKNFGEINSKLKEKLSEMSCIREKISKFRLEEDEKKRLEESILIKSKEQEIEEKIKCGKKLTTDDFLVFQEIIKSKKIKV
ncbi:hypothetical protein KY347_03475 [Candidatus Woesearchaeota archaeon]|nr:hypothetical protein [Candidatus Woesearchaeota archaeon]